MRLIKNLTNEAEREMDEIVFEGRNKDYGAYAIRRSYNRTISRAFLMSISMFVLLSAFRFLPEEELAPLVKTIVERDTHLVILEIPEEIPEEKSRSSSSGEPAQQIPLVVTTPVVPNDTAEPVLDSLPLMAGDGNGKDPKGPITGPGGNGADSNGTALLSSNPIVLYSDTMPEFPGGKEAMTRFIMDHVNYPNQAMKAGATGKVMVRFYIAADGSVTDPYVVGSSPGFGMDEEAVKVVKKMPKWKPGRQNGRAMNVWMVLPIRFELE